MISGTIWDSKKGDGVKKEEEEELSKLRSSTLFLTAPP